MGKMSERMDYRRANRPKGLNRWLGAELEAWLINSQGRPKNVAAKFIEGFEKEIRPNFDKELKNLIGMLQPEFDQSSVEFGCIPSSNLFDVCRSLTATITALDNYAKRMGLRLLPFGVRIDGKPKVVDKPRYRIQERIFGFWFREMLLPLAGFHTHDDLSDNPRVAGDQFKIANMLRPVLISFNACTPLFSGRMTKFTSARTHYYKLTYEEHGLPKNGCLLDMDSVVEINDFRMIARHAYNDIIARMEAKGVRNYEPYFDAVNTIWGGVREGKYGTVESRISDANPLLENLFASLALHRGLNNLLFFEEKPFKVEIHAEKCIYSREDKLMIPGFKVLQHLEELSLLSLYPRGGYNGIHPELLALCTSAVKFAEMGLPVEHRMFLKPYKKMVLGEEEALFIRIWKFVEEKNLLRERDLSLLPENAGRLRNFIYNDIFLPSLREAQEEFSIEPNIII